MALRKVVLSICLALIGLSARAELPNEPVLGQAADWSLEAGAAEEIVEITAGTRLYLAPESGAPILETLPEIALPVVERSDDGWTRVHYGNATGWLPPEGLEIPLEAERVDERYPAPPDASDPDADPCERWIEASELDLARQYLPREERSTFSSGHTVYTNVENRRLLRFLDRQAGEALDAYGERYGLETRVLENGEPCPGALVIFADDGDYRALVQRSSELRDLYLSGHTHGGLIVFPAGREERKVTAGTLIHELTHFFNSQFLGSPLPPWLDEGLASDLALAQADTQGPVVRADLVLNNIVESGPWDEYGRTRLLVESYRRGWMLGVEEMVSLERTDFLEFKRRALIYTAFGFWVRYLLESGDDDLAEGFRGYLAEVAAGGDTSAENLSAHLGRDFEALEQDFKLWLQQNLSRLEFGIR